MSRSAGRRVFLFSWERLGRGSSKAAPEVLDMKYRSEFKHGFTNRDCLQCAILKALHCFQKKEPTILGICNFPSKCSKGDFQDFQNV